MSDALSQGPPDEGYVGRPIAVSRRRLLDAMRVDLGEAGLVRDSPGQ